MCEFNSEVPVDTVSVWGERERKRKRKKKEEEEEKPGAAAERDCKNNGIYHMRIYNYQCTARHFFSFLSIFLIFFIIVC